MFNPRFPHTLRVWRSRRDDHGEPITDEEGNPSYEVVMLNKVVTIDHEPQLLSDGSFDTEQVDFIHFGYRTQGKNTRDTVDVVVSDFKLSTPMFLNHLNPGDRVEITDYERTFWGEVVKKATYNLGSNIWINEVKN